MSKQAARVEPRSPTSKYGVVGRLEDGQRYVKFVRRLPFPVETVWSALTDADQLASWFPGLSLEPHEGGRFEIRFSEECDGPARVSGTVTGYSPPFLLVMGTMRWELESIDDECTLTFTDFVMFDDRSPTEVINSVLAGWHKYLDSLERMLRGGKGDPRLEHEIDYSMIEVPGRD